MRNYKAFILIITLLSASGLLAQPAQDSSTYKPHGLNAQVRVQNGKIYLRWAPATYALWDIGNTYGYVIERIVFKANPMKNLDAEMEGPETFTTLPAMPLMPWSLEKFKAEVTDTSDRYAGVAMELLYGEVEGAPSLDQGTGMEDMMMDQNRRFAFALMSADFSAKAADGMALRYVDADVKPGYFYEYRIRYNHVDTLFGTDTVEIYADMTEVYKPLPVVNCFSEEQDGAIKVMWLRSNNGNFTAYDIERSADQKSWKQLNRRPFVSSSPNPEIPNVYVDTTVDNGRNFHYRVRGYTAFGDKGDYSATISGTGKDLTPPAPPFNVQAKDDGGVVLISWEDLGNTADHDGYYVGRSYSAAGGFEKISKKLPKDARAFVDFQADPLANNYYSVFAVDKTGNEAMSYVALGYITDSVPPEIPTGLKGTVDTNGIVKIEWSRGPEADIIGYRVYWANDTVSEYSQLTGDLIPGINYTDSVNVLTLSEEVYYKIAAVDHRYNHSELSAPVRLLKPDLVPPAAPLINNYQSGQLSVEFQWIRSSSVDVVKHRIERKKDDETWREIASNNATALRDSNLVAGSTYGYRVCAVDDAGNTTCSSPLMITTLDRGLRDAVKNLKASKKEQETELSWDYTATGTYAFVIYQKADVNLAFTPVARLDSSARNWQTIAIATEYGVRVVFSDGGESEMVVVKQ